MNKDLRQEIAKIITPAWPSSSLLRADKILSLVYSHLAKKLPTHKGKMLTRNEVKQILKKELLK